MFRVSQGTVLRRAAAVSLVALSTTLVACGDDEPTAASDASTPAQTEASTPPDESSSSGSSKKGGNPSLDSISAADVAKISDTPESAATIKAASDASIDSSVLKKQISDAKKALKSAGKSAKSTPPAEGSEGAIQVADTSIIFYDSVLQAAKAAQQFEQFSVLNPGYGRIARADNRVFVLATQSKMTASDKSDFSELRKIVEGGV